MDNKDFEGLRQIKVCRQPPAQPPQPGAQIRLECVGSYNLELEIGDRRGFSMYTLREVPMFLVEAFGLLRRQGMDVEGIFRKEGNINRIKNVWPTYFGCKGIPKQCGTHDICSMIKRFFRELKTPLLVSQQTELLQIVLQCDDDRRERVDKLLDAIRQLPSGQLGTFSFLVRQLKYFGENHEKGHHMTAENLALIFAPTLFRDDFPAAAAKKKKGSQVSPSDAVRKRRVKFAVPENLISSACNENELKVTILYDLIVNAHKVGVPRDYYIASRRPSDLIDKSRSHKVASSSRLGGVPPRSSSARPSSRHHAFVVNDDLPKVKPLSKRPSIKNEEEAKFRRGRRSSSTVREIFTTISNRVLRRGLSPGGNSRRPSEDSACGTEMVDAGSMSDQERTPVAKSSTDGVSRVYVNDEEIGSAGSVLSFKNEEVESDDGVARVLTFENIESEDAAPAANDTRVRVRQNAAIVKKSSSRRGSDDGSVVVTQRRSRRESPRKQLAVSARIKPISPVRNTTPNWMAASPVDEPSEMNTKQISSTSIRRRESDEKKIIGGKVVKRNSSKGSQCDSISSPKVMDPSSSLLEDYGFAQSGRAPDRRRRHTTPVKPSALLRRNQPNTLATGLKAAQVHIRDRRSTTSFGSRTEENGSLRRCDKKKRGSSNALSCSGESMQNSDEENDRTLLSSLADASAILQQKGLESRERRAKRHKRREEGKSSKRSERLPSREMVSSNLLDDVTNELERLERVRGDAVGGGSLALTLLANGYSSASAQSSSKTITTSAYTSSRACTTSSTVDGNGMAVTVSYHSTQRSSLTTSSSVCTSPASVQASSATNSQKLKRRSSTENSRRSPSKKSSSSAGASHRRNTTAITAAASPAGSHSAVPSSRSTKAVGVPYKMKSISVEEDSMRMYRRARLDGAQYSLDENEFALSNDIKQQILNASTDKDIKSGPAHMAFDARPSVAYIKKNNRGIVQQRVNQFALLSGAQGNDDTIKAAAHLSVQMQEGFSLGEFVKPVAPPASHGLRHAERRPSVSPMCCVSVSARTRKFEALAKAASERAARKGFSKKAGNLAAKISRRAVGERREARITRRLLSKSLGKLELLTSESPLTTPVVSPQNSDHRRITPSYSMPSQGVVMRSPDLSQKQPQ